MDDEDDTRPRSQAFRSSYPELDKEMSDAYNQEFHMETSQRCTVPTDKEPSDEQHT